MNEAKLKDMYEKQYNRFRQTNFYRHQRIHSQEKSIDVNQTNPRTG